MKHKGIRIALVVIEACIALFAVGGGIALLIGGFAQWLPLAWLQGTPFSDYTIPGLALTLVVGGGMLLASATLFIEREVTVLISAAMGLIMIGFEVVEIAIIDRYEQALVPSTVVQQVLFTVLGLVIFGLATYLWMTEYRGKHSSTRHASQAHTGRYKVVYEK